MAMEVVRTTLIRAARVWREEGMPWLSAPPLIEMLDEKAQKREPYPISWAEQARLLPRLAAHHQGMVEFAVNTGVRDENGAVDGAVLHPITLTVGLEVFKTVVAHTEQGLSADVRQQQDTW